MEEKKQKINMNIGDAGHDFFAHETSINFNPTQFILDFKCITPRVDPRAKESAVINLRHNIVMLDAYHAKRFQELFAKVIDDYEKEFGKIEKPKPMKIIEKKRAKGKKESIKEKTTPSYFG
ncbi:MAG: DUF3467 domain-containing protein [Nanoarchaeota archaeon]|nr:DUF3467 domain-containing protein [Nanoarchaeota archaeon]